MEIARCQGSVLRAGPSGAVGKTAAGNHSRQRSGVVVDPERFEIRAKPKREEQTLAGFIELSKKYRGAGGGLKIDRKSGMKARDKRGEIFDGSFVDED